MTARRRLLAAALGAYLIAAAAFLIVGGGTPTISDDATTVTDAHRVRFVSLDGNERSLREFAGRPLVLNFFASTCEPCKEEMPDFERAFQARRDQLAFLGLATEGARPARGVVETTGVTYDIGLDPVGDRLIDFGGFGLPTTVFISAEGEVLETWTGALSADALDQLLAEHFQL